jgi:hypothetical protein
MKGERGKLTNETDVRLVRRHALGFSDVTRRAAARGPHGVRDAREVELRALRARLRELGGLTGAEVEEEARCANAPLQVFAPRLKTGRLSAGGFVILGEEGEVDFTAPQGARMSPLEAEGLRRHGSWLGHFRGTTSSLVHGRAFLRAFPPWRRERSRVGRESGDSDEDFPPQRGRTGHGTLWP